MNRVILHIDMDAFFASVEQRDNPQYQGKPVIVGADPKKGKGRGVVSACSYEARKFGIHSAMPISQAYFRCPNAIFLGPRMDRYQTISRNIREIFYHFTPLVEPISIDEAFLDITGSQSLFGSPGEIAVLLKNMIREREALAASIGIAPNKFIAKIASDVCKPDGLLIIKPDEIKAFLHPLSISQLWGVGEKTEQKLLHLGINSIGQLAALEEEYLESLFGKIGRHLWQLANGIDERNVEATQEIKSISHEITFEQDTDDLILIHQTLLSLAQQVSRRAWQKNLQARTISLKLRYHDFRTINRSHTLSEHISATDEIFRIAKDILSKIKIEGKRLRLVGISLSHLIKSKKEEQISLFQKEDKKKKELSRAEDKILHKFGSRSITRAFLIKRPKSHS